MDAAQIRAAARRLMAPLEGNRLVDELEEGETVLALATGMATDTKLGLVVVTDQRIFAIWAALRSARVYRPVSIGHITAVVVAEPPTGGGHVIHVTGDAADERFVCFDGWEGVASTLSRLLEAGGPPPSPPPPSAVAAEIERLAELWRSGALTDDEFSAAKALVLRPPGS